MAEYYVQNGGVGIQYVDMAELSSAHIVEQVCVWFKTFLVRHCKIF